MTKTDKIESFQIADNYNPKKEKYDKIIHEIRLIVKIILKIIGLLGCLYFFVVALNLMSTSFPLIGGRYASEAFRSNVVLTNPLAGLMIGLLATVIVQSSSTSTSIIVSMVASEIIPVRYAIPIIMGSNIGTSITSTLVALSHAGEKEKFRLSFAGATVHDMFNLLTVLVLLPVELSFRYLETVSLFLVGPLHHSNPNVKEPELIGALTKPLTESIIQIDKKVLDSIASNKSTDNSSLIKRNCKKLLIEAFNLNDSISNGTNVYIEDPKCNFLFKNIMWPEWLIGLVILIFSLALLSTCLLLMVKILGSIFKGPAAHLIQKSLNSDFPGVFKYFTGITAIMLGCILTIIVQSSSVFTSTLTPLVGMGLVTIERVFPLTLGSNIGTTVTGILASISGPAKTLKYSLQIALCHSLFNITGILIWYPIPYLRKIPIRLARILGNTTAEYRWFAIVYCIGLFFVIPILTFVLSFLGSVIFITVLVALLCFILAITAINLMQSYACDYLPEFLKTWAFLPHFLHSLKPYDDFIMKYLCCCNFCKKLMDKEHLDEPKVDMITVAVAGSAHTNKAFEHF